MRHASHTAHDFELIGRGDHRSVRCGVVEMASSIVDGVASNCSMRQRVGNGAVHDVKHRASDAGAQMVRGVTPTRQRAAPSTEHHCDRRRRAERHNQAQSSLELSTRVQGCIASGGAWPM